MSEVMLNTSDYMLRHQGAGTLAAIIFGCSLLFFSSPTFADSWSISEGRMHDGDLIYSMSEAGREGDLIFAECKAQDMLLAVIPAGDSRLNTMISGVKNMTTISIVFSDKSDKLNVVQVLARVIYEDVGDKLVPVVSVESNQIHVLQLIESTRGPMSVDLFVTGAIQPISLSFPTKGSTRAARNFAKECSLPLKWTQFGKSEKQQQEGSGNLPNLRSADQENRALSNFLGAINGGARRKPTFCTYRQNVDGSVTQFCQ